MSADQRIHPGDVFPAGDRLASARMIGLASGERVRLVEAGDAGQPPIILLHGWGATAYNFRHVIPSLAARGFRAIAPDLRGHGWSEAPTVAGSYSRSASTDWLRDLLDTLEIGSCVLAGQSIGGAMALDAASELAERIRGAVLLAPIGFTPIRRVAVARALALHAWHPRTTPRWLVRLVLDRIYGSRRRWTDADLEQYWIPLRSRQVVAALAQAIDEYDFAPRETSALAWLGPRLTIRFGARDRLIPWQAAAGHAAAIGADVAVIPGAGHVPAEEAPDEVVEAIVRRAAGDR